MLDELTQGNASKILQQKKLLWILFKKGLKPTVQYGRSSKVDHLEEKLDRSFFIFDETMRWSIASFSDDMI